MKSLTTDDIRKLFVEYFRERGHTVVPSSALVPENDPTLLFTNSGMVQFKDVFTGKEKRDYTRATSAQKCVRAGGKHNDLENVGYTPRHHTFFEMLGNFSFGDYFKKDAIAYAWDLITRVYGLPAERLCVTVFRGEEGIPADDEAASLWRAVGVPEERIFRLGKADNYWQMGDTGPQGPCSEIHYFLPSDMSGALDARRVERSDGWMEIWNLVFMQFFRDTKDGPLEKLPRPSIDTGAGLERLAMVMQEKASNYETDAFRALIDAAASALGKTYGGTGGEDDVSLRVIADHSRATAFLIADGVQPSNEGRGYVLRRIMRRAIRHGDRLGFKDLFFHDACLRVVERMKHAYPELGAAAVLIEKVASSEEASFRRTLERGIRKLSAEIARMRDRGQRVLEPAFVAELYHTYGFPIDLTRVIASEQDMDVDEAAAQEALVASNPEQADRPIGSEQTIDKVWFEVRDRVGASEFLGYEHDVADGRVVALVVGGRAVDRASAGDVVDVVLDRTPFYGESGGQIGDRGVLTDVRLRVEVTSTTKPRPDLIVHRGKVVEGAIEVGQKVSAAIDRPAREATRKNHSATHLLHLALKEVLGSHVQQKGSLVAPDRLRFDYAHFEPLTPQQIAAIEERANRMVLEDAATIAEVHSIDEAKAAGAVMLFGEKYGDRVRMVRIGGDSLELCGGTHVRRSGEIGLIKIVADEGVASGVRRLEAVTGLGALRWAQEQSALLGRAASVAKTSPEQLTDKLEKLLKRAKELEKEVERAKAAAALGGSSPAAKSGGDLLDKAEEVRGMKVLVHRADGTPVKALREVSDKLRDRIGSGVVVLGASEEDKAAVLVAVTKDLAGKVHAGQVVKEASAAMGGSGGGRPDFAQGGGKAELLDAGLARAREVLARG